MSPRLKVSECILQRIEKLEEGSFGFLLGISDDNLTYALGLVKKFNCTEENSNDLPDLSNYDIISNCPANINYCGVFYVLAEENPDNDIIDLCKTIDGTPVVIGFDLNTKTLNTYFYEEGVLKVIEHAIINRNDLLKSFLHLRLTATIPLSCDFHSQGILEAFNLINKKIIDGNSAFHFLNSEIFILGDKPSDVSGTSFDTTVAKLFSSVQKIDNNKNQDGINFLNVGLYLKGTNNDKSPQLAPLIKYVKKIYKHLAIELSIDSLSITPAQLKLSQLYPILVESSCRNLALNKENLLAQLSSSQLNNVSLPVTYHFLPPSCDHFVSIVYPEKQALEQSLATRKAFHMLFSLPLDGPMFRPGNAFQFSQGKNSWNMILNPHEGVSGSGVPEGEPSFVQGNYTYHHYMQDKFDDDGWGCAYRSLQTIFSWFRFQGYTTMPIPTHREIQQCLVNIGDKPSSFVGSEQWIGSTEVSFVLDTMLGVTCRILTVSSGEEMSELGGELSYHFKKQGTPIMIGGGVLAHTILGVDYNKKTGAIKFLILDPHYTGVDDLKIIQSKGWCGWKGLDFWKKNAFYNMCLPLRPNSI